MNLYNPKEYWNERARNNPPLKSVGFCGNTIKSKIYWRIHHYIFVKYILSLLHELLAREKRLKILEVGCRVGRWASLIAKTFKKELSKGIINYQGIDISSEMILLAKKLTRPNLKILEF